MTAEDEYKAQIERWKQGAIQSVKVVPDTAKVLDRYTLSFSLS